LAELRNIVAIKDACGDIKQSAELLIDPPTDFSILTGEDLLYYSTLALGGHGGILAAAHLHTEDYIKIFEFLRNNDHHSALALWKPLMRIIPLYFDQPNPAPLKYILSELDLIDSPETRLPIVGITDDLKRKLDKIIPAIK
jgi:4-hydroxy-tetrahydrodipicolinate synthase